MTATDPYAYLKALDTDASGLIKGLQTVQEQEGYIADEALLALASHYEMPIAEVEGVVSFYAQFKRTRPGRFQIAICDGTACHIKGSLLILDWISAELGIADGETSKDGTFSLETVACLGCCSLAPVLSVNGKVYGNLDRKTITRILKEYKAQ